VLWELNSFNENSFYANSKHKFKRLEYDRVSIKDSKGKAIPLKTFPRFPDTENRNNFIYPYLAKRKTEYYDSSINQEQLYKVQEGLRNLAARVQKVSSLSHPKRIEFERLCNDILGFAIGIIPANQNNNNGMEPGIYVTNNHMIPIRSMGEGVANILGFIVTLLTEDNKLYLIEELENDIHPAALKKLLDLIIAKSKNNQFIISTHSHIVLKHLGVVDGSKIFHVEWSPFTTTSEGEINIPTSTVKEIENKPEERISLLEKLGYEFQDYELHEGYLLLEESSAESVINGFIIPNFVPEIYNRVKTIAARGVNDLERRVIDFHRLFVFIHSNPIYKDKAWVLADGDAPGLEIINKLKQSFKTWPVGHFINFKEGNFEKYYPSRFQGKVESVLKLKDKFKQEAKTKLLIEVMDWSFKNRDIAIEEFSSSAKEVIAILKTISKTIKKR
jgi:predicted ATPase